MDLESIFVAVFFCLAIVSIVAVWGRVNVRYRLSTITLVVLWLVFLIGIVALAVHRAEPPGDDQPVTNRPIEVKREGYVGSDTCQSCHPDNHASWHASYHRTMTQVATPESVIGDFDNVRMSMGEISFRLNRRGDEFFVDIELPSRAGSGGTSRTVERPIVMTTGSHHMQAYWFPTQPDTRYLGMLPFVYLAEEKRWIPRSAAFLRPPDHSLRDEFGRWNEICIRCHAVNGEMGVTLSQANHPASRTNRPFDFRKVDTRVAEFGIACEACHGPGAEHVRANRNSDPDRTIVNPSLLPHDRSSQVCGQCHGVFVFRREQDVKNWMQHGYAYRPGDDLLKSKHRYMVRRRDERVPPFLRAMLANDPTYLDKMFWPDGMVRISGREYSGLLETACYLEGQMSCLSCHQMHQGQDDPREPKEWANDQLEPGMHDSGACIQCHTDFEDHSHLTKHTHHPLRSSGSDCYNCHMSYTTYGLLKAIRSHQIDIPSVAASLETGRPNACNQCHLDKTLAWTARHLADWYAIEEDVQLSEDEESVAASVLWLLKGDAGQRALMAWSYGWPSARQASGSRWLAPYLAQLLEDPYETVRFIAHRSLRQLPGFQDFNSYDFLGPPEARSAAHREVHALWTRRPKAREPMPEAQLLIDEAGNLRRERMNQLLKQRDDRPVWLQE